MQRKENEVNKYSDVSNVEAQRNFLTAEEFPEGAFQNPIRKNSPVENKSTPWKDGQRKYSAFNYENKSLHEDLPRQFPGAHPPHDDPNSEKQPPYNGN